MGLVDLVRAIEGFSDGEAAELNRMRHLMWAPIAAMGGKVTPRQLMPLPTIDGAEEYKSSMTKEEFLALARKYKSNH